ncbi:MAG: DUF7007 domain-containing protein [Steroidobacteraceae bacterium]
MNASHPEHSLFHDTPAPLTTPWGHRDMSCDAIAPGIWSVSTDCHGGIVISEERREAMPSWAAGFRPFSGLETAFEEDLDWVVPCAVWPQEFKLDDCVAAIKTLEHRVVYFTDRGLDVDAALQRLATSESRSEAKSLGQAAYERDVAREPSYHDGKLRRSWSELDDIARESWERNPTVRACGTGDVEPLESQVEKGGIEDEGR